MYKSEQEIMGQHISLRQTYAYLEGNAPAIKDFFGISGFYSVTFTGSGASYSICKSAELSLKIRGGLSSMSFPAGDLSMNMPYYHDMLNGTLMIVPSRSGETTEVITAVEKARRDAGALTIAVCATQNSRLSASADFTLEMPWIYDNCLCATRTISNLYTANLYNIGLLSGDNSLIDEIRMATDNQEGFISRYAAELEGIGQSGTWDKVLILADSELAGVAEAGSIAIQRMCHIPSTHCHILDVRHGQIDMIDHKTLVIGVVTPLDDVYQSILFRELSAAGAQLMTISGREDNIFGADLNILLPDYANYAVRGIPLLFCLQAIGFHKALADGRNPDGDMGSPHWVRL